MGDTYRGFLEAGMRAGARYALAVPKNASVGLSGTRVGRAAGSSLDFRDHREYQAGDDLRRIDWNAFARTDKLIVKQYREEVVPHLDLVIDGSSSSELDDSAKAEAIFGLAAFFATASANGGYSRSTWLAGRGCRKIVNGHDSPDLWTGFEFEAVETVVASLSHGASGWRPGGFRILIGDLLWPTDPGHVLQILTRGAAFTLVVQILARREANPEEFGNLRLVDAETGTMRELFVDETVLKRYRDRLGRHRQNWHDACRTVGAGFVSLVAEDVVADWRVDELVRADLLKRK